MLNRISQLKRFCLSVVIFALSLTTAHALDGVLSGNGGGAVFVWKDSDAQSKAFSLIEAGVHKSNPILLMRLMSCVADPGDKAVVTDMGFASHTIMVTSGKNAGCEGVIAREYFKTR